MRCVRVISLIVIGIFLISFTSAVCTLTFDKTDYVDTETVVATMSCDTPQERSQAYSVNWTNSSGALIEQDTGTTPATTGQNFLQDYILSSIYLGAINATLSGNLMEGEDTANVTALGGAGNENILVITNASVGGGFLGLTTSLKAIVKDENGKKISGGLCKFSGWSNDETTMLISDESSIFNGEAKGQGVFEYTSFEESKDYKAKILCYCGGVGSGTECIDEDGLSINNSIGSAKDSFTTSTWLTVNTLVDDTAYEMKENIFVCANVTNVNYTYRIPLDISYELRCSAGSDVDTDLDRTIISTNQYDTESRGISVNTTQMQCYEFIIPEHGHLMGRDSECYASTNVWVIDNSMEELIGYATTSPVFNITSDELNLEPDWQWISSTKLNSIFNLSDSQYRDINGTGTGNIDLRIHTGDEILDLTHAFDLVNFISNITVQNLTSNLTEHTDYEIEFTEDGYLEIELRDVDLSKTSGFGWWNITLDFNNFEERQVIALEGVENKTGTFHLDVNCPSIADVGDTMNCSITAQVEDTQTVEKEVDFTCYITDGVNEFSGLNYNQMINKTSLTLYKEFLVPSSFSDGTQYVLQCHADYYNLGSRRDSFYDTFTTSGSGSSGGSTSAGSGSSFPPRSPITGGAIDEGGEGIFGGRDIPFIPDEPREIILLLIFCSIVGATIFILMKKNLLPRREIKIPHLRLIVGVVILIGFLVIGGTYGYNLIKKISEVKESAAYFFMQDPLFRGIILTTFIVGIVIVLFKMLNIRMEIKLGESIDRRRFHQDRKTSKLQHRINQEVLKVELAQAKRKVRKK